MTYTNVLLTLVMLLLQIGIGAFCRRIGLFDGGAPKALNNIIFYIAMPCMVFCNLVQSFTPELMDTVGWLALVAVVYYVVLHLLSYPYARLMRFGQNDARGERGIHQYVFIVSNVAFIGLAVAKAFWGEGQAMACMTVYVVLSSIYSSTLGPMVLIPNVRANRKKLLTPNLVSAVIGFCVAFSGMRVPAFLMSSLGQIGAMTTPLALFFTGYTLLDARLGSAILDPKVLVTTAMRLLVIPAGVYLVLRALTDNYYLYAVPTAAAAMPTLSLLPVHARNYGSNVELASCFVAITQILAIVTIPILALLLVP